VNGRMKGRENKCEFGLRVQGHIIRHDCCLYVCTMKDLSAAAAAVVPTVLIVPTHSTYPSNCIITIRGALAAAIAAVAGGSRTRWILGSQMIGAHMAGILLFVSSIVLKQDINASQISCFWALIAGASRLVLDYHGYLCWWCLWSGQARQ
jgi:hypothetical protein